MISRRTLLRGTAASVAATSSAVVGTSLLRASADPVELAGKPFTFVSCPDVFNGDVGDLSQLPNWDGGLNSINDSWRTAIDHCWRIVKAHEPDAVFVAGDLVEGRWNIDSDNRQLFGPVSQATDEASLQACRRAITTAGSVYYGHYNQMMAEHGLRFFPAVGDHEVLDDRFDPDVNNRWSPQGAYTAGHLAGLPDNRWHLVPHSKRVFADHFTKDTHGRYRYANRPVGTQAEGTAYAVNLGKHLTLVTVDVFHRNKHGVQMGVAGGQLDWLRRTIRRAKHHGRVVIVQGHVPMLRPYRTFASGNLYVPGNERSKMYRTLNDAGADFYFCGEVHDTTVIQHQPRDLVQISHGCIFRAAFNFLVGHVYADGTTHLTYYEVPIVKASEEQNLWASDAAKHQRTEIVYGAPARRGVLVARGRNVLRRTEKLGVYHRATDTWQYDGNLHPEKI